MKFTKIKSTMPKIAAAKMASEFEMPKMQTEQSTKETEMSKFKGLKRALAKDRNAVSKFKA